MKNSIFNLKKLPEDNLTTKSIEVRTRANDAVGLILCDGAFIPVNGVELYNAELRWV